MDFKDYLNRFEKEVLIYGFENKVLGKKRNDPVSVLPGKLSPTNFGVFIGNSFQYDKVLAFDYYGMVKISSEILNVVEAHKNIFPGVKLINAPLINFASIMREQVFYLAPDLLEGFDDFKDHLVKLRWHS